METEKVVSGEDFRDGPPRGTCISKEVLCRPGYREHLGCFKATACVHAECCVSLQFQSDQSFGHYGQIRMFLSKAEPFQSRGNPINSNAARKMIP